MSTKRIGTGHQVACHLSFDRKIRNAGCQEIATEIYEQLQELLFSYLSSGNAAWEKMKNQEKDIMEAFKENQLQILVSDRSSVGVNVPNATVMLIIDADRFRVSPASSIAWTGRARCRCFLLYIDHKPEE